MQHPRPRQHRDDGDLDSERELAWLERDRLEQLMQSLAGCWTHGAGEQGLTTWWAVSVLYVPGDGR
eukprot:4973762-Pyramimonas_sp.AAC.1